MVDGFLGEEEFGRGGELVEGLHRDVEILVGVVETGFWVGFAIGVSGVLGIGHLEVGFDLIWRTRIFDMGRWLISLGG